MLTKDVGKPLDSTNGLKYLSIIWFLAGSTPRSESIPSRWHIAYYVYSAIINIFCNIYFLATMVIQPFFIDSYKDLVENLSLSCTFIIIAAKHFIVLRHRHVFPKCNTLLKLLDERSDLHSEDRRNIFTSVRSSQLYILYLPIYLFCGAGFLYNSVHGNKLIYNSWNPTYLSNPKHNYIATVIYQYICQILLVFQCVFSDTFPLSYLTLMIGHLQALSARISRIGWNELLPHSQEKMNDELRNCIKDHKAFLALFDCIRPAISESMFCQFFISAFVLCLIGITIRFFSHGFNELFFQVMYAMIVIIQIFPCCWLVNKLMDKSNYLTTAMYSCNWMDQNVQFRKMLIIFMQRSQKTNAIMAGDLAPVTLQTFIAIVRFSFSMFTILMKM